ncbi:MAG: hypothetical protein EZS28_014448 [Streblomastix strix]|uniref:Uncharacterized protein n=1 Tax=Streblomastix strix TaxID=222440 RepID=A0A5J4W4W7_9EUKA|nr:MAG: hypothetical protein EZS28_014448 [Streblomastix strix]
MAACSNAIKYAKAYEDFDINGVYPNFEDNSQKFHLTEEYWQSKVKGYIQQDKFKKEMLKLMQKIVITNISRQCFNYLIAAFVDVNSRGIISQRQIESIIQRVIPQIMSGITGGLSNVMHRVNRSGIDFIKRIQYDKDNKKVTVLTTDHRITQVVGVDFNSLYPSVMSSEPHQFIKYTRSSGSANGKTYMCGSQTDMNRIHFNEGDTDSAYWSISGNVNEDFTQQFNAVINDREFYNDNAKFYFPSIRGDIYDEKKILGLAIERQGVAMVALAPKNYMIETNYNGNSKIKLKRVNQKTNKFTKAQIVDCVNEGKITKCTNMRLGQQNHQMSQLAIEKNGITGIHDKMIVLSNQSCCPYIFSLTAKDYSFQDN